MATEKEYALATCASGLEKRIISSARSQSIYWTLCGKPVAEKHVTFKRGKPVSTDYVVNK